MSTKIDELVSSTSDQNQIIINLLDNIYTKTIDQTGIVGEIAAKIANMKIAFETEISNNRKTYYETEALYGLQNWNTFFWYIYYTCFILFLLGIILAPNSVPRYISIIIAGFILIYPYVIELIIYKAKEYFNMFYKIYPKNVYNNL